MTKTSLVKELPCWRQLDCLSSFWGLFSIPLANMIGAAGMARLCAGLFPLQFPAGVFDGRHSGGCVQNGFGTSGRRTMQEAAQVFHLSRMLMFMTE